MKNEYTMKIKVLMKDFIQHNRNNEEIERPLVEVRCPIEPDLMGYTFDKILGFEVKYKVWEKVDYIIVFKYKNTVATLGNYKLSYRLSVEESVKDEILCILKEIKILLEKALLKYSEEAVKNNRYSLPNNFSLYKEKLDLLELNITNIPKRLIDLEKEKEEKKEEFYGMLPHQVVKYQDGEYVTMETPFGSFLEEYWNLDINIKGELSYTIELYIENWFAFIEHIFSLLLPMTNLYNSKKEYSKYLNKDWRAKVENIFGDNDDFRVIIDELSKIKEIYRNRFSHGMFSREKQIRVQIKDFGMYPLWIGKKHLRGFHGSSNILTFEIYNQVKKNFDVFFHKVKSAFPLQFNVIEANIPTFLDTSIYGNAFQSEEEKDSFIKTYLYYQGIQRDIDW